MTIVWCVSVIMFCSVKFFLSTFILIYFFHFGINKIIFISQLVKTLVAGRVMTLPSVADLGVTEV